MLFAVQREDRALEKFCRYLKRREKAPATVEKYLRDVRKYLDFARDNAAQSQFSADTALAYKHYLVQNYAPTSVNSMIAALNCYFVFMKRPALRLMQVKVQRSTFLDADRELERSDFDRLVAAARNSGDERTACIMQTLGATGIRVSELASMTVECVREGCATLSSKGKVRTVWIAPALQNVLLQYARQAGIEQGPLFCGAHGRPLHRSSVWAAMKKAAVLAGIDAHKVFPHNLRHLFAVTFYRAYKDIAALSDLLGHSRMDTTRIYIMTSGAGYRERISRLSLVV